MQRWAVRVDISARAPRWVRRESRALMVGLSAMMPLDRSVIASVFSVGRDGYLSAEPPLPPNALVIVIQDRPDTLTHPPSPPLRPNCYREGYEMLPVIRAKAEKAYAEHSRGRTTMINVAG